MESVTINGQYGKRNPLFMYQGTAGCSILAALSAGSRMEQEAQGYTAEPAQSGERRCGTLQ